MNGWRQILAWEVERPIVGTVSYLWVDDPDWHDDAGFDPQMRIVDPVEIRHALEQMQPNDIVVMTNGQDFDRDELRGKIVLVGEHEVKIP